MSAEKNVKYHIIHIIKLIIILSFCVYSTFSQNYTQTIKGTVTDKDSKFPLIGANVIITTTNPPLGSPTDEKGNFSIKNVPVGRHTLKITYLGYEEQIIPALMVGTGKEIVLNIELQEAILISKEVTVTAKREKQEAINTMASVSSKTFNIEETQRYAGGFNDLSRMTESFAGVASFTGEGNEIVIRGNSPRGLLWRVEGIEVANPNHFPRGNGSSGGGMSLITSDIITNSDFFTGAFPAEYGNALSGVFDINLRKGNAGKREYAVQVGLLGTEATAEGPVNRKAQSSYLIYYRYSTLKLLSLMGINLVENSVIPEFQDLSFKLHFPTNKAGTFSLFGIGGISSAGENAGNDTTKWIYPNDRLEEYELHKMGAIGIKHLYNFQNNNTYIKTILSSNIENNSAVSDSLNTALSRYKLYEENFLFSSYRCNTLLNHKINKKNTVRGGLIYNLLGFDMFAEIYNYNLQNYDKLFTNNGNTALLQGYIQWKYRTVAGMEFNTGLHYMQFLLNNNYSVEPRFGVRWRLNGNHALSFGSGLHSRLEAISFYYFEKNQPDGSVSFPNKNVGLAKALHNVINYETSLTKNIHLKAEAYYQYLFNVPVEDDSTSRYSTLNYRGGLNDCVLNNNGKGYNYGLEITLEKYFSQNYYFLFTSSLFDSKYKAPDGKIYNTFYNSNYIFNLVGGKEFRIGKNKNNIAGINVKILWKGGNRMIPVALDSSIAAGREILDETSIYENKTPDFIRMDIGLSFRRNQAAWAWILSMDFQNIFNRKNVFTYRYNNDTKTIEPVLALPFIPIASLRLEF
ncbi:MAG: TonB-dependent receptor [Bacteroidia bacterium]|nr:TonB-dependent receptor [Bacteroidia bacterium]